MNPRSKTFRNVRRDPRRFGKYLWLICMGMVYQGQGQIAKQTYLLEAQHCTCEEDSAAIPANSVQLCVRLDGTTGLYTCLPTLLGCTELYVKIDKKRFPVSIIKADRVDGVGYLEPIDVGHNARDFERKLNKATEYLALEPDMLPASDPNIVILQGKEKGMNTRKVPKVELQGTVQNKDQRVFFEMPAQKESDIDYDGLVGGPVWVDLGEEYVAGVVMQALPLKGKRRISAVSVANVLDGSRYVLFPTFLKQLGMADGDCLAKNTYWNGYKNYEYRVVPPPEYQRMDMDQDWQGALKNALTRIREHLKHKIPQDGSSKDGTPALCVYVNDLENASLSFLKYASTGERETWRVLPLFVKCYSNVYCKKYGPDDERFKTEINELNYMLERISSEEIDMMVDLGLSYSSLEDFTREQFAMAQLSAFVVRWKQQLANSKWIADVCNQRSLIKEMEQWSTVGTQFPKVRALPDFARLQGLQEELGRTRQASIQKRLKAWQQGNETFDVLMARIEQDTCLTSEEAALLVDGIKDKAAEKQLEDIQHGTELIGSVQRNIARDIGTEALKNIVMRVFRVEDGVGVEITIFGGGAIADRRVDGKVSTSSDTVTLYRKGFRLASVGDTLAIAVAREFWQRVCADYADPKTRYSPEYMVIYGFADGVPVVGELPFTDNCKAAIVAMGITDPNKQLAFARAWTVNEKLKISDPCALLKVLKPKLTPITYTERGGEYRGITLQTVIKRL